MNKFKLVGLAIALLTPFFLQVAQPAQAEMRILGTASTGETLTLDTNSVSRGSEGTGLWISAVYYLDSERIDARISCRDSYWVVEGSSTQYRPQSQATQNLISTACAISSGNDQRSSNQSQREQWLVYDPPSNVRSSPNGEVLCVIRDRRTIWTYGDPRNGWYRTPACDGADGWINESQIRPLR